MTKRKPLNHDDAAKKFVFQEPEPEPELPPQQPQPQVKKNIIQSLTAETKERTIRLTVDLPESMHRKLSMLAAQTGRKKVEIVRLLLDDALNKVEE